MFTFSSDRSSGFVPMAPPPTLVFLSNIGLMLRNLAIRIAAGIEWRKSLIAAPIAIPIAIPRVVLVRCRVQDKTAVAGRGR